MEKLAIMVPALIGREEELSKLKAYLDNTVSGKGSTVFIAGEAGIGKTRLVTDLKKEAEAKGVNIIQGWCLAESLEPLMPIKSALREAGLINLVSGEPPPLVVSAYLINEAGKLIAQAERKESDLDPDIFAGMLQAVGNFVQDSLSMMGDNGDAGLNSLGYGDYTILIQSTGNLSLAMVIKGTNSEFLIEDMKSTLDEIGNKFDDWAGETSSTNEVQPKISWFVDSGKFDGKFLVDDPKIRQENLFDNILLGIQRASAEKPLLLFLDDLQWSDPTTLNLVHYLSRNTRENKILILGTYRPEDIVESHDGTTHQLDTSMQGMNREDLLDRIDLKRLGPEDTEKIITSALGNLAFDKIFYEKIYHETEGTPFFVLEVVKLLVEDEAIAQDDQGIWQQAKDLDEIGIPSKVYDVVKRRLDRLMKEQRKILDCASVIGEEFQSDVIGKVMGLNKLQLLENLSEIEKTHKLIHYLQDKYRFDHAKVKEVLYQGIGGELRKEYHRIVCDTIAELHKDNLDEVVSELAYHYYKAEDERAGEYLVKAGDRAKEGYANEEAVKLYQNALEMIKEDDEKVEVLEKLGDIRSLTGAYDRAIEHFQSAKETAEDSEARARMLRKVGDVHEKKGTYDKSLEVLAEAKELIEEGTAEHGRICRSEGIIYWRKGEYDQGLSLFQSALKTFERSGAGQKDIGNTLRVVGNIHWSNGDYDNALQFYKKSLAVMDEIGEQLGIAAALNNIGGILYEKGELTSALEYHERSLEIRERIGDKWGIAHALNNIGGVYWNKGDPASALEYHEQSLEIREKIGDKSGIATSFGNIGIAYKVRGELDRALEHYERSLEIRERIGDKRGIAHALNNIGEIYHDKGEQDKALEYYGKSLTIRLEIADKRGLIYTHCGLAGAHIELENAGSALEHAKKALEISVEIGAKTKEGTSHQVLGKVYREKKEWDKAIEEFEKARSILVDVGDKQETAKVLYEYALLFKAKGEPDQAREHLEKVLFEFEEMGMKLWEERARKELSDLNSFLASPPIT